MNENPDKSSIVISELGLRQRTGAWWKQQTRLRRAGYALLIIAVLAALWSFQWRQGLVGIWVAMNVLYGMTASAWALVHGRAVWQARDSALRWAICLSVFSGLLLYSLLYREINNLNDISTSSPGGGGNAAILLLPLSFFLFCGFMLLALLGAAIGSFAGRRGGDHARSARAGITLSMTSALLSMLVLEFTPDKASPDYLILNLCFFSSPLLTRLYIQTLQQSALSLFPSRNFTRALTACLVWRWHIPTLKSQQKVPGRKTIYKLDMRGIALGFAAAFLLLHIPSEFIGPLQSLALTTLTHLHANRSLSFGPSPPATQLTSGPRSHFVILRMDAQTRYEATQRSEAAVQADMIDLLHKRGAAHIILPLPYLHNKMVATWTSRGEGLAPDYKDVEHSRRDTRRLADVVRSNPTVLLAVPPGARPDDSVEQLLLNSAPGGESVLRRSPATYLPIVPAAWTGKPPLPALLCASLKKTSTSSTASTAVSHSSQSKPNIASAAEYQTPNTEYRTPSSLHDIPGCAQPQVYPDEVVIDFDGDGPREDFLHATYAEIRANTPLLTLKAVSPTSNDSPRQPPPPLQTPGQTKSPAARVDSHDGLNDFEVPPSVTGEWKPAADLLRGRVVFLDSLPHPMVSTPAGVMTQSEAQAYATSTLLSREGFQRVPRFLFTCLILLLGMIVGYTCARHEPLDAGIRLLVPLFLVIASSTGAFLVGEYWLDPVVPLLTIGTTAALATQFRFVRERAEKQRASDLFGRFVAPHMVQTWLEQHEDELGMVGVREKICVLFADVRQFTAFAEQHDATEVIDVINAYMTALTDALHAHGGILDKYTGDGLMAFFQITHSPQEDLTRAVLAALAMREAVLALSARQTQDGKPVLNLGISLHYGDAIVGLVGNPRQQVNYTAMGLTVVVAARLQTIAKGGDIIVSEEVYQETQNAFTFAVGEPVQVKGLTQSVRPYRVLDAQQKNHISH